MNLHILSILGIGRSRFFEILKIYRQKPDTFSIDYKRESINRKIDSETETITLAELSIEKSLIEDSSNPIKHYNYSYIKDRLLSKYGSSASLPTIIDRAKKYGIPFSYYVDSHLNIQICTGKRFLLEKTLQGYRWSRSLSLSRYWMSYP